MILTSPVLVALLSVLVGIVLGYILREVMAKYKKNSLEVEVKKILLDAKNQAVKTLDEAKKKSEEVIEQKKKETKEREGQIRKLEEKVQEKDESLEKRRRSFELDVEGLKKKAEEIKKMREEAENMEQRRREELQKIANLSEDEAKKELLTSVEKKYETDILARIQKIEIFGQDKLEQKARDILASVIQRIASSTASEVTTTSVNIPSDDIKGKIIISSFDAVRRQIARIALENLILDGRIQPARIEETVDKAKNEIEKMIKDAGEKASFEVGIFDIDPRLSMLLGRLKFRTSYGQNVLQHSIEMSHVAGMLASELGADVAIAKKGALLHDIGKAVDHEIQGTHVEIGRRILHKFNVDHKVVQAMQSHHEEYPYETLESIIVQTADAISASRPGARRDSVENYLKRLEDLERIANTFPVVEKSYAIQAGREIRVFVTPDKISDLEMKHLARDIANSIEQELKYPGEIKVHVIRENRAVEYAR